MKKKKTLALLASSIICSITWLCYKQNISELKNKEKSATIPISGNKNNDAMESSKEEKKPSVEDRIANLRAFYQKLEEINASHPKKTEVKHMEQAPTRKLIKTENGTELIEVTYEDGGKTYLPNFERFDVTTGTVLPKEFQ